MTSIIKGTEESPDTLGGLSVVDGDFWQSEACARLLLKSAAQGIFGLDSQGRFAVCNPATARLLGYAQTNDLLGQSMHALVQHTRPDGSPFASHESKIHLALRTGEDININDELFWRADGSSFPVEYWCHPLRKDTALIGCIVTFFDITQRRRTQLALHQVTQRLNMALKASKVGTWNWNITNNTMHWDDFTHPLFGMEPGSFSGRHEDFLNLLHPDDRERVSQEISDAVKQGADYDTQYRVLWANGEAHVIASRGEVYRNKQGQAAQMTGVCWDVTEAHSLNEQLSYQATHDPLTDLVNRREFERRLQEALETVGDDNGEHALCYLDLDQFKVINDTSGHIAGDELLHQLANVLKTQVRKHDTLARLGGDEFGLLIKDCTLEQARQVSDKLHQAVDNYRFSWEGKSFQVGVSIGLVPINSGSESMSSVLSAADAACYAAKDAGRNRIHEYHEEDTVMVRRHGAMLWVVRIDRALEEDRFELVSQAIVPVGNEEDEGEHYEILVRMKDEDGNLIAPGVFLDTAEQFNLTPKIDRWVINHVFEWLKGNPKKLADLSLCAINLSGLSVADEDFKEFVIEKFQDGIIPPSKICFEITETAAIANIKKATAFMNDLKSLGCVFALDDFGSGLSSFAYLKNLPVDLLKIDGVFVKDMHEDPINLAMVKSINEVGHVMGKKTIAEFVENDEILSKLRELGIDYAQGYGIGKPKPIQYD